MTKDPEITKKRKIIGVVTSDKMNKTRVVSVSRLKKHPKYLKYYHVTTKFKAHDENNEYKTGDKVTIEEARPMSKEKRWRIIGKVENKKATNATQ
jgi:small subunit ribosomal protein S17